MPIGGVQADFVPFTAGDEVSLWMDGDPTLQAWRFKVESPDSGNPTRRTAAGLAPCNL